ncbi:PfkB family carbohydrate kinase [Candidatus Parabeggiatoa sp. HSG14]|uniref:PfkB family carbohydrate kinase n=1 Tax=Candidatus Parabeggiatoa sp. HSG14 TaxID=3055593 RepID=UPI0025A74ED3|nr:PfkB family carbohydrate kinase [Thiotrichales bacterium HSG14]
MSSILGIGIATLDVINIVDGYPDEDSKIHAINQRICRGGNATNTLVVLSQLGHHCTWGGVLIDEPDGQKILEDLTSYAIDTSLSRVDSQGKVPVSYIILNQRNGSRTIIHHRDLSEFSFADFQKIDLSCFNWLHFEGRNVIETARMLEYVKQLYPDLPISLEIEKPRPLIKQLFTQVDVLLFSKTFAQSDTNIDNPALFLQKMQQQIPDTRLVCAWGAKGGYALEVDGTLLHNPAYPPSQIIDTLGAGDTFNAGIIDGLCRQQDLATALNHACRLAGKKCGQVGFKGLVSK